MFEMKGKRLELTGECPRLDLQLDACLTQCLLCGLLGLHLSGLLCKLHLCKLGGIPLVFNCRVCNVACAGLDQPTGRALLVVQVSLCYCRRSRHDGAMGIDGSIVCLLFFGLPLHQLNCQP